MQWRVHRKLLNNPSINTVDELSELMLTPDERESWRKWPWYWTTESTDVGASPAMIVFRRQDDWYSAGGPRRPAARHFQDLARILNTSVSALKKIARFQVAATRQLYYRRRLLHGDAFPVNPDGTVTVYRGLSGEAAETALADARRQRKRNGTVVVPSRPMASWCGSPTSWPSRRAERTRQRRTSTRQRAFFGWANVS